MRLAAVFFLLVPLIAAAETAYVTDSLRLRLYADAQLTSVLDTLESGDQFEVISRDAQTALVELEDGRRGYVSAAYIVTEKPARLVVDEAQAEVERLTAEIQRMEAAFGDPAATIDRLREEAAAADRELDAAVARTEALEEENRSLTARQERYRYSLPYTWVGGAMLICLIAGIFVGMWWIDRQNRRRHGGIRVY